MGDTVTQKGHLLRSPMSLVQCHKLTFNYYVYYCAAKFPCIKLYELFLHDLFLLFFCTYYVFADQRSSIINTQKEEL